MSVERECGCGRKFRKGVKALVSEGNDGKLVRKTVCLRCARRAERVVLRGAARVCSFPDCDHVADVCKAHVAEAIVSTRTEALRQSVEIIRGQLAALAMTVNTDDAADFIDGRIEGMSSALAVLVKGTRL